MKTLSCSEDPDVKGTETDVRFGYVVAVQGCSEDPDVKGTETCGSCIVHALHCVAARIPM